jgi:hypothetical protein
MRFMFFTDLHLKSRTPIRRTGSFEDDVLAKLVYLLVSAQQMDVDFIVCGGDLFDNPNPSFRLASRVMNLIASSGVPWHHVLGNHEIIGHNPDSYDMGVLAFFEHLDNFTITNGKSSNGTVLKPIHYRHGVEENKEAWHLDAQRSIICAHAMVVPTPVPFTHVTPQTLKDMTGANLVLLGHYHDPWANIVVRTKLDDDKKKQLAENMGKLLSTREPFTFSIPTGVFEKVTLFLNTGSVSRISLLAHNLKRTPRAIVVDIDDNDVTFTAIPITVARDSDNVFKIEEAMDEKRWDTRVEEFLAAMENVRVEGIEASTVIINAAKARAGVDSIDELPPDVKNVLDYTLNIIEKLEAAETAKN